MPEWPDLAVVRRRLEAALAGRTIIDAVERLPLVLRLPVPGPIGSLLAGRRLAAVEHRGKFLTLAFDDGATLVVNAMLTGTFWLAPTKGTCLHFEFSAGAVLDYADRTRMGRVHYVPPGADAARLVQAYDARGLPASLQGLAPGALRAAARGRRSEVRNLLLDQDVIAGIGNAYADEILWRARLHPKRRASSLSDAEWTALDAAIREAMRDGEAAVEAGLPPELGDEVRDHMQVRGHAGAPCPRCGAIIVRRHLGYLETDFCPRCQVDPSGHFPVPAAGQGW